MAVVLTVGKTGDAGCGRNGLCPHFVQSSPHASHMSRVTLGADRLDNNPIGVVQSVRVRTPHGQLKYILRYPFPHWDYLTYGQHAFWRVPLRNPCPPRAGSLQPDYRAATYEGGNGKA
jgi:hypothetical protein